LIFATSDNEPDYASEVTMRRLNMMIATALITSEERNRLETIAYKFSEDEAQTEIQKLEQQMPIPGFHTIPHGMDEINRAARFAADKDDFYDRSKRTT